MKQLLAFASLTLLLLAGCTSRDPEVILPNGAHIGVEIAWSTAEQQRGLMFRESLAANRGMLFPYERESARSFWMRNTLIPLDIIFLNKDGAIVTIHEAVPCADTTPDNECPLYSSTEPAQFVLEIAGGEAGRHALKSGDILQLKNIIR